MTIIITENQLEKITNFICNLSNNDILSESEIVNIFYSKYNYDPESKFQNIFFEYPEKEGIIGNDTKKIVFINKTNPSEKFEFNQDEVKLASNGSYYAKIKSLKKDSGIKLSKPSTTQVTPSNVEMSSLIKKTLEKVYRKKEKWMDEDDYYSAGLRDVYPIADKTGNKDETWSIMNYFDTKPEIHQMILNKFEKENSGKPIEEWIKIMFEETTDDYKNFVQTLVDRQWESIKNGIETENRVFDLIRAKYPNAKIQTFLPGSKMDRYEAVDMLVNGKGLQIKPLNKIQKESKYYLVKTYGMKNYTNKRYLDYIVFVDKQGDLVLFENKNYSVIKPYEVKFFTSPKYINS